jgi:hypothetical protein
MPGCPIRKSADQRLLAPPRSLSQLTTSFLACPCQGIHHEPLLSYRLTVVYALSWLSAPRAANNSSFYLGGRKNSLSVMMLLCWLKPMPQTAEKPLSLYLLINHHVKEQRVHAELAAPRATRPDGGAALMAARPNGSLCLLFTSGTSSNTSGARGIRTPDILLAKQALYQLSYGPGQGFKTQIPNSKYQISNSKYQISNSKWHLALVVCYLVLAIWCLLFGACYLVLVQLVICCLFRWGWEELNLRPHAYQACALTT